MTNASPLDHDQCTARIGLAFGRKGVNMAGNNAKSGNRLVRHTACFSLMENAVLMTKVELAGVSISAYLRAAALDSSLGNARRRPSANQQEIARLIGELGILATAFRSVAECPDFPADPDAVAAALDDLAEMRLLCFDALGRKP